MRKYDFGGWATKFNLKCADGRTIRQGAFEGNDGQTVPLVWNHQRNSPNNVLGHAVLENRDDGVYAYGYLNDTESGQIAKTLIQHGDVAGLSIYANRLKQKGGDVLHGMIREVSLVLAGANPGAFIDTVISHSEDSDEVTAIIFSGEPLSVDDDLNHSDKEDLKPEPKMVPKEEEKMPEKDKTVKEVFDELTEEQKNVVYFMIGQALEEAGVDSDEDEEEEETVKHNLFDNDFGGYQGDELTHDEMTAIIASAKRGGSLKEAVIEHGITDIDYLFPEAQSLNTPPSFIQRDQGWVNDVMNGVHKTPFSRIKSMFANLTEEDARAKGYIKGSMKKEQVFALLKRTTSPQTIYKKQKLDRDDVIDITDFDVVAWIKSEMRTMLDEEIARAALVGDGRLSSSDDKISEEHIRPIWTDDDLYTIKANYVYNADSVARDFIRATLTARKDYKGSGNPVMFIDEATLTEMLLTEDTTGRYIYESVDKLATVLRVSRIITCPVMENQVKDGKTLRAIVVNLKDYNIGADKGGAVNLFDDFDIDYNAYKYLIETRCSGALVKPYSAIAISSTAASAGN